ncbi:MAG: molybdopterin cofactor-binding domain-containing protein [Rubrivivax sp.]
MQVAEVSRRHFLATTGAAAGTFTFGFAVPFAGVAQAAEAAPEVNAWVIVKPDDTVVIRISRMEMGQGTLTGLAQLVAEELDADWSKVTTEYPTPGENLARKRVWGDFGTAGSRGIRSSVQYVREGGAAARLMLVQAAAAEWKVPVSECKAVRGVISHNLSGRSTTYGKVAAAAAKLPVPQKPALKDPKDWTIAGQSMKRLHQAGKVNGSQMYSIDFTMPGMLNAAIRDCPIWGGKLKSFDAAAAQGMRGVKKVVQIDNAVVVIADTWWRAKTALEAVKIEYDPGPHGNLDSQAIDAMLTEGLTAKEAFLGNKNGDIDAAIQGAAKTIEATYSVPYQNHAPMEPMNATALVTADKCEVWTATQNAEAALATASAASGLPLNRCDVHRIDLGGGFGRRATSQDFVEQAVKIAKTMPGTPIKLIWSREEDQLHGCYHPVTKCKMTGALDKDGNLVGLRMRISGQSILATIRPQALVQGRDAIVFQGLNAAGPEAQIGYTIPNLLVDHAMRNTPVRPGFWRGVNNNQNAIYLECFMDELAHAAGVDALEFRRRLMKNHPKHLAVLNAVAEQGGWGKPAPKGVFRGLAQHMGYGSYVAACAEVSVSDQGEVKVHRIVAATDCGHAVNPRQIAGQIEGSFAYGLGAAMLQQITLKDGQVVEKNFDTYNCIRMADMPAVESIIMPSGGFWGGVGEPTIFVAAPAVLNAIFAATGKRVRDMPLKNHDLRKA